MSSMPLNLEHHHHFTGSKHALAMASTLQPLQRAGDTKHRLDVHAVSDTSSPESAGKLRATPVQTQRLRPPFAAAGSVRSIGDSRRQGAVRSPARPESLNPLNDLSGPRETPWSPARPLPFIITNVDSITIK